MPAIRSNSSLSSSTVMSPRQLVTRNTSLVSSSNTRMTKTSGAKSSAKLADCGSPTRGRLWVWARGCAARGRGPAEPAPCPHRRPPAGSERRALPGGLAARPPPAPAASSTACRMAHRRPRRASSPLHAVAARHHRPRLRRPLPDAGRVPTGAERPHN